MPNFRPIEIFLLQMAFYLILWVAYEYLATLLSVIIGSLALLALLFASAAELIERSKVPRSYFIFLGISILAPLVAGVLFLLFNNGLDWLQQGN